MFCAGSRAPSPSVYGMWQLAALHKIESEDVINSLLRFESGATGVVQASTAFWPGYTERTEIPRNQRHCHHLRRQTHPLGRRERFRRSGPIEKDVASGASDPMAISLTPFERQFLDFGDAIRNNRKPLVCGEEGLRRAGDRRGNLRLLPHKSNCRAAPDAQIAANSSSSICFFASSE